MDSFDQRQLKLSLKFKKPNLISIDSKWDRVKITFKQGSELYFLSAAKDLVLDENSQVIERRIQPQMEDTKSVRAFVAIADAVDNLARALFLTGLAF